MLDRIRNAALRAEAVLNARRAIAWSAILLAAQCIVLAFMIAGTHGMIVRLKQPLTTDFSSFYAAGSLADAGRPDAAYHRAEHFAAEQRATSPGIGYSYFYYPPVFLLLCAGLGALPYLVAFMVFEAATLAMFVLAMRRIVGERRWIVLLPILAFPSLFWNLGLGQNAFLSAGLFAWATLQMQQRRTVLAGLLFGAICFKPHLGILIPFALAGGRQWRAFAAAACSVAALGALSVLAFGTHTWHEFFVSFAGSPDVYQSGRIGFELMVSVFGAARLLGLSAGYAYAVQAIATLAMAALVFNSWRSPGSLGAKCAMLLAATVIAAPLVLFYDLMLLAVAMAWLVRAGRCAGFLRFEKLGLLAALLPIALARSLTGPLHLPLGLLAAVLLLGLALRRQHAEGARGRLPAGAADGLGAGVPALS